MYKTLLVFAHRGEAQKFIENLSLLPIPNPLLKSFSNEDFFLLLTGEGGQEATRNLSIFLTEYGSSISQVYNLGVAGGLSSQLQVREIYPIRTVYRKNLTSMEFRSFTFGTEGLDCVSVDQRLLSLNSDSDLDLKNFGDLVDRELWAIAEVCAFFHKPLKSYKLISDKPTEASSNQNLEVCQNVFEQAKEMSQSLYSFFQSKHLDTVKSLNKQNLTSDSMDLESFLALVWAQSDITQKEGVSSYFHFTKTLRHQAEEKIQQLIRKVGGLQTLVDQLNLTEVFHKGLTPKVRAMKLLKILNQTMDPTYYKIHQQIEDSLSPLQKVEIKAQYSDKIEEPTLTISFKVETTTELKEKIKHLDQFDSENYFQIFEGHIGV